MEVTSFDTDEPCKIAREIFCPRDHTLSTFFLATSVMRQASTDVTYNLGPKQIVVIRGLEIAYQELDAQWNCCKIIGCALFAPSVMRSSIVVLVPCRTRFQN